MRREPPEVLAVATSREGLPRGADHPNLSISEHRLDIRGTSKRRRSSISRRVLFALLRGPLNLADLRRSIVGANEDVAESLRAHVAAGRVERLERSVVERGSPRRRVEYRVTERGRGHLKNVAELPSPKRGELTEKLRELLARDVLSTDEMAIALFGSAGRRERDRARSLGHYLARLGHAHVERGTFGPAELGRAG